jgi:ATP-dependent protease ClpP protease subunit
MSKKVNYQAAERLAQLVNELVHGVPAPKKTLIASYDSKAGDLARLIDLRLHGQPAPAPGPAEKGTRDQAWKAGITQALVDVVKEQAEEAALDEEIRRLDRDLRRAPHQGRATGSRFRNAAIPKHTTATTDAPWDAGENIKRISNDEGEATMRLMYAWVDPDKDPDTKAAYKMPHHMVSTAGKVESANIKACQSVIGVLNGSRGGADIPDKDRQGVWDHVSNHLKDGGEKPAPLDLLNRISGVRSSNKKFWQFRMAAADNTAELILYGDIQSERSWLDDSDSGVYADEFVQDMKDLGNVSQITCRINSIGGDIFAAIAIYTQLKTHAARIVCIIDGLAASAATLIVMAGDEIQMPIGAMQMIHDPLATLIGNYNTEDLEKIGETLDAIKESIVSVYASRTGLSTGKIENLMTAETWMDVDAAIELGFCDTMLAATVQAEMKGKVLYMNGKEHDLSRF